MPTICPHCRAVRLDNATVPDWQCPLCGKAYAKAGSGATPRTSQRAVPSSAVSAGTSIPWGKLLAVVVMVYGAWIGLQKVGGNAGSGGISHASRFAGNPSVEQLGQLAASRQASDVLMYSAAWCSNCAAAKGWMGQYGFKYQECDIDKDSACMAQLRALDPQGGVPYLIVRGQHTKDGFDSEQFVLALAK